MTLAGAQKRIKQNREGLGRDLEIVDRLQRLRAMLARSAAGVEGGGWESLRSKFSSIIRPCRLRNTRQGDSRCPGFCPKRA